MKKILDLFAGTFFVRIYRSWNFHKVLLFCLAIFLIEQRVHAQRPGSTPKDNGPASLWIKENFGKGKIPPFSFVYEGKDSRTFIKKWKYTSSSLPSDDTNMVKYIFTYSDPKTGLQVKCSATAFKDFNAVEWVMQFINTSGKNTPLLEKAAVIDQGFSNTLNGPFILHHAKGSNAKRTDFEPMDDELQTGKNVYMSPEGGRSSDNTAFPFFNIEMPGKQGIMVAVGWTGKWYADIEKTNARTVSLKSGMERMQLILYPKEQIRTPKICLLFWKGEDRMVGHNQFRRFILAHHTRKINGKPAELPLSSFLAREGPRPCVEHTCSTESFAIAEMYRFNQFNILPEVFWIDAGWYSRNITDWWKVGNWTPNPKNLPNGFKPITDVAHNLGSKFILWFEPERFAKGMDMLPGEKPEWLQKVPDNTSYLFDLGNPEARLWLTDYISNFLKQNGVDYYRQDFNFRPMPFWEKADVPQRIGISEIRHIEGLYAYWDSLLVRFPNLIIDNCAAGGRRLDL
ncbi:MAG TPA: alpha-galactosidase, partial [Flavitalea sp.]|nr:alpha-galactosidase [Flavitalea sp.]